MDSLRLALTQVKDWLDWLPNPVTGALILAIAVLVALALHKAARKLVRQLIAPRYPAVFAIFTQMRGLTRLAVLVIAMMVAIPVAPLGPDTAWLLTRLLLMAIIGLIGWAAMTALNIGAQIYLRRFRIDVEDNLLARKHTTQIRILLRSLDVMLILLTVGAMLMTFESVRQYGVSLFASAGVAGLAIGLAARPLFSNLIAGVQLAITQPIRLEDAVIVENEWGNIEEINATYVVVRLWDWRRMIVPLTYFIEKPFQNWTRETSALIGVALFYLDYRAPIAAMRDKLGEIVKHSKLWDGRVINLAVTDAKEHTIEVRCLASAASAGAAFDLRCEIREKMIDFLQREHRYALPQTRADLRVEGLDARANNGAADAPPSRTRTEAGRH